MAIVDDTTENTKTQIRTLLTISSDWGILIYCRNHDTELTQMSAEHMTAVYSLLMIV